MKRVLAGAVAMCAGVGCAGLERVPGEAAVLVIVTPRAFENAVDRYAAERGKELPTQVMVLEDVLARERGVDDAEKLKRALFERWSGGGRALKYVLLVGDADVMPVRYMVLDRNTDAAFNYAFYPSDLYYADLAKGDGSFEDWNGSKEGFHAGYFGEVRGEHNKDGPINFDEIDYRPEVGVGRWPVSTVEEVEAVAAKTLAYEVGGGPSDEKAEPPSPPHPRAFTDPAPGTPPGVSDVHRAVSLPRMALVATGGWIENRGMMDGFAERLKGGFDVRKRYWGGEGPGPGEAQVVELLNQGVALVLHSGHGSDDRWDGSLGVGAIGKLRNEARPAVMMSAGCSTARMATLPPYEAYVDVNGVEHKGTNAGEVFEGPPPAPACYQKGKFNTTGLGEELVRAARVGAVAYIGCDTGSQPCGMTLMEGFVDGLAGGERRLGDCWAGAVRYYWEHEKLAELKPTEDWYPPSIFFQGMKFVVYGDPSVEVGR